MTDAMPELPPASTRQGDQDQALDRANAIRILTLRTQRLTYDQIAKELGYADASGARHALLRALDRHEAENVTELRALENLGLDADERVLRAVIADPQATARDKVAAVNARTRLSARRARMNGLDAPMQVSLDLNVDAARAEVAARLKRMRDEARTVQGAVLPDTPVEG